jgi:hypothetical protein
VFTTTVGTPYEPHNLRRDFRRVTAAAGLGARWVPKELRTSFVSMMSYQGVPVEEIARLAGHASSRTTEVVYRRELRPVITTGAEVMDQIFQPKQRRGAPAEAAAADGWMVAAAQGGCRAMNCADASEHHAARDTGDPRLSQRVPENERAARFDELLSRAAQAAQRIVAQQAERHASCEYAVRIEREAQHQAETEQHAEAQDDLELEL